MNLLSLIPFEMQVGLVVLALAGLVYLVFIFFGLGAARTAAIWGSAGAAILLFASRAFRKGQSYEIDRANKAADKAIRKANEARARAERNADAGRLRDDDGFKRRD
jgi:hypothetical protein